MDINQKLTEELDVNRWQIDAAVTLIDEGNTIPFISRYRKEATGSLNDEQLRKLHERLLYLRNLEEKKELMDKNGRTEISQLLQDYVNAYNNNPQIVPNYQVKWNSILQEETIGECLPQLAAGKMTPAQMVETADESVREYEKER